MRFAIKNSVRDHFPLILLGSLETRGKKSFPESRDEMYARVMRQHKERFYNECIKKKDKHEPATRERKRNSAALGALNDQT